MGNTGLSIALDIRGVTQAQNATILWLNHRLYRNTTIIAHRYWSDLQARKNLGFGMMNGLYWNCLRPWEGPADLGLALAWWIFNIRAILKHCLDFWHSNEIPLQWDCQAQLNCSWITTLWMNLHRRTCNITFQRHKSNWYISVAPGRFKGHGVWHARAIEQ